MSAKVTSPGEIFEVDFSLDDFGDSKLPTLFCPWVYSVPLVEKVVLPLTIFQLQNMRVGDVDDKGMLDDGGLEKWDIVFRFGYGNKSIWVYPSCDDDHIYYLVLYPEIVLTELWRCSICNMEVGY